MPQSLLKKTALSLLIALLACQTGCSYTNRGKTESYFDSQLDKSQLQVYRVAIIPNRLPLVIKEPEFWRKSNWELIAAAFRQRGYEVVDYESSNTVFRNANLPIEDTGSSEEKFAQAASELNADILIMPYYSTSFSGNSVAMTSHMNYNALVSLQIYSTHDNRFVFRADGDGNSGYSAYSGIFSLAMSAISSGTAAAGANSRDPVLPLVSLGIGAVGLIFAIGDLMNGLTPAEEWWKRAFTEALNASLEPFFSVYPKPAEIPAPEPDAPIDEPQPEPDSGGRETLEDILRR